MNEAENLVGGAWGRIVQNALLNTPDRRSNRTFIIHEVNNNRIVIRTEGNTEIPILRAAIVEAVRFLINHDHDINNPCEIRANKTFAQAGPLCQIMRRPNNRRTMISSYVIPILAQMGIVDIMRERPNATWLIN